MPLRADWADESDWRAERMDLAVGGGCVEAEVVPGCCCCSPSWRRRAILSTRAEERRAYGSSTERDLDLLLEAVLAAAAAAAAAVGQRCHRAMCNPSTRAVVVQAMRAGRRVDDNHDDGRTSNLEVETAAVILERSRDMNGGT